MNSKDPPGFYKNVRSLEENMMGVLVEEGEGKVDPEKGKPLYCLAAIPREEAGCMLHLKRQDLSTKVPASQRFLDLSSRSLEAESCWHLRESRLGPQEWQWWLWQAREERPFIIFQALCKPLYIWTALGSSRVPTGISHQPEIWRLRVAISW